MTPSLIPRHWLFQAVVSGIVTAAGYGLGTVASRMWRRLPPPEPSTRVERVAWWALATVAAAAVTVMTVLGVGWQRDLHRLMGMPVPSAWGYVAAVALGLLLAALLVGVDTALASMQYSYLPSWLSFLVDSSRARQAGGEPFNAVYERWGSLPEDDRPLLLVFGESLGAYGSEAAFSGVADLRNRTDGIGRRGSQTVVERSNGDNGW